MIQFVNNLYQDRLRMAFNNDVIRFYSTDYTDPMWADVYIGDLKITLYPNPQGQFYFNFRPYVSAMINTRNFEDTLQTNLDSANPATFLYNVAAGTTLFAQVTIQVFQYGSTTTDGSVYNLGWLAGVQQLGNYRAFAKTDWLLLSPPKKDDANGYYLKYWQGYPFDLAFYANPDSMMQLTNQTNLIAQTFTVQGYGDRLFFSDGRTDETLEDVLPLDEGFNTLNVLPDIRKGGQESTITIEKIPYRCGVYLKWFNTWGGYSYWLFEDTYSIDRSTKALGELDRDLENLENSFARTTQIGRETQDILKIVAELLTEEECAIVAGILDSPKVYLFTGQPYARNDYRDWIEVNLKTSGARIKNPREALTNFAFDIELPQRYTQTL